MEYLTAHLTPSPTRGWVGTVYVKTTMPTAQGHPRTLRTFPDSLLSGLRGLDTGTVGGMLHLHLQSMGTLPLCGRCAALLTEDGSL